ncbi:unnamed protein product [Caenorhabditis sp. 36 PRJEB53466]|nr:unnamed protein product [Caenorhabditis sp. 36 PRJEB53466]
MPRCLHKHFGKKGPRTASESEGANEPERFFEPITDLEDEQRDEEEEDDDEREDEREDEDDEDGDEIGDIGANDGITRGPDGIYRVDPAAFIRANCFDRETGALLPRSVCEENLKKLHNIDYEADNSAMLKIAQEAQDPAIELLASTSAMLMERSNELMRREREARLRKLEESNSSKQFNIADAKSADKLIALPSGYTFFCSDAFTRATYWKPTEFEKEVKTIVRTILAKVSRYDPFFCAYCASSRSSGAYIPIGSQFYMNIADYIIAGFGMRRNSADEQCRIIRPTKNAFRNFMDRFRKTYKETTDKIPNQVAAELKQRGLYRQNVHIDFSLPPPVHN